MGLKFVGTEGPQYVSGDDSVTLSNVTISCPGIGKIVRDFIDAEVARIKAKYGAFAPSYSKISAAIHEAGHIAWHLSHGERLKKAWIKEELPGRWIGTTVPRSNEKVWVVPQDRSDATVRKLLNRTCLLYCGVAAEQLFAKDYREGSSLDEAILTRLLIINIEKMTGINYAEQLLKTVIGTLRAEEKTIMAISEHLNKFHRISGVKAERLRAAAAGQ
jgi:hypothetical protein